jgi:hypothetical protein
MRMRPVRATVSPVIGSRPEARKPVYIKVIPKNNKAAESIEILRSVLFDSNNYRHYGSYTIFSAHYIRFVP